MRNKNLFGLMLSATVGLATLSGCNLPNSLAQSPGAASNGTGTVVGESSISGNFGSTQTTLSLQTAAQDETDVESYDAVAATGDTGASFKVQDLASGSAGANVGSNANPGPIGLPNGAPPSGGFGFGAPDGPGGISQPVGPGKGQMPPHPPGPCVGGTAGPFGPPGAQDGKPPLPPQVQAPPAPVGTSPVQQGGVAAGVATKLLDANGGLPFPTLTASATPAVLPPIGGNVKPGMPGGFPQGPPVPVPGGGPCGGFAPPPLAVFNGPLQIPGQLLQQIKQREQQVNQKLEQKLKPSESAPIEGALGLANWNKNSDGTFTKQATVSFTKSPANGKSVTRKVSIKRTLNADHTLADATVDLQDTLADGSSHTAHYEKALQSDGSYKVTLQSTSVGASGVQVVVSWNKTIGTNGNITGDGTITTLKADGSVDSTETITIGGGETSGQTLRPAPPDDSSTTPPTLSASASVAINASGTSL